MIVLFRGAKHRVGQKDSVATRRAHSLAFETSQALRKVATQLCSCAISTREASSAACRLSARRFCMSHARHATCSAPLLAASGAAAVGGGGGASATTATCSAGGACCIWTACTCWPCKSACKPAAAAAAATGNCAGAAPTSAAGCAACAATAAGGAPAGFVSALALAPPCGAAAGTFCAATPSPLDGVAMRVTRW